MALISKFALEWHRDEISLSGIDPFVEAYGLWKDFHDRLIGDLERELSALVPDRYVIRIGERAYIAMEDDESTEFTIRPDVAVNVSHSETPPAAPLTSKPGTVLEEPVTMQALIEAEFHEPYVEIYDYESERQLVTVIEILSPSNKHSGSPGWNDYLRKRSALLQGAANFVEIDFLRGGRRMPMGQAWPESPNYILVSRRPPAPTCKVWPVGSLRPAPSLAVPLLAPDPDVVIDMQPLIDGVYHRGRYALDIDYRHEIAGLLNSEEAEFLATALPAKG